MIQIPEGTPLMREQTQQEHLSPVTDQLPRISECFVEQLGKIKVVGALPEALICPPTHSTRPSPPEYLAMPPQNEYRNPLTV